MPDVTIAYKNSTITSLSSSGAVALSTAGKYLEDDLTITYTAPLPNLESISIKPENCASTSTQITPETYICETDNSYPGTTISMNNVNYCNIGNYLNSNIKIELNKTYHCAGQLFIKWDDDDTEEYYYIDSDFTVASYNVNISLNSFTWEGSTGATQTFGYMRLDMSDGNGYKTRMRPATVGSRTTTKSGVLLPGSFYRITQVDTEGYGTINLDFNSDPRFYKIYQSLAYRSMIASSAPYVSEWCDSFRKFEVQQFAGQPFSGDFTFNNVSYVTYYTFGSVYIGTQTGTWNYFGLNFPSCSSIYAGAFVSNLYLQSVFSPKCTSIGGSAFLNCQKLITISFPKCTSIGNNAFQYCNSLNTISFPECTFISNSAFQSCSNLTIASFPKCTSIGGSTFANCKSLTTISFPECTYIGSYAFSGCKSLTTASFPKCVSISNYTFNNCSNLATIFFPECTTISNYTFQNCTSLTTISFSKCTTIGSFAFQYCSSLNTISFPECVTIGSYAFSSCSLTTVSFPKCTSIGNYAFWNCNKLESVYFMGNSIPSIGTGLFTSTPIATVTYLGYFGSIYVPSSLLESYKIATNWATWSARMVGI